LQGLLSDPTDKIITFTIAYLIILALPRRTRQSFSQSATADKLPQ
jgi:energy-coupling factor transport system substrate-specific component